VVDEIAVRKDRSEPSLGTKRGDALRIILMQVKGGSAAAHAILSDQASCFTRPQSTPVDYSHKLAREFARNKFEVERFAYTGEDLYTIRASPWRGFENRSKQPKIAEVQAGDKNEAFRVLSSRPSAHFHKFT